VTALTADRIRYHVTRLGLTHLTDTITELVQRAETAQMGYLVAAYGAPRIHACRGALQLSKNALTRASDRGPRYVHHSDTAPDEQTEH
jgi:hypothetical protein